MMDLFNQTAIADRQLTEQFYNVHGAENNSHSETIYEKQAKRLSRNTRIMLQCMIDGEILNGIKCMQGITTLSGETATMIEYRKRKQEIIKSGINVSECVGVNGVKQFWLSEEEKEKAKLKL